MNAALSRIVDRLCLEFAAVRMPRAAGHDARLEEARALLAGESFGAEPGPVEPVFENARIFRFDTPRPTPWPNNNVAWGRLYRAPGRWQERPAIVLLHGWNDAINHFVRFRGLARQFNRAGINAVILTAPYHFRRWPKGLGAWGNFLCPDLLRTAEAAAQAVAENRAVTRWLLRQGCPAVGVWGISLGGWLAGLTARHEPLLRCAVLVVPVCRVDRLMAEAPFCREIRAALGGQRFDAANINLTAQPPALPRENILLISADYDLFVPADTVNELWDAWGRPEIWRLREGHLSVLAVPGLGGRTVRWAAERLGNTGAK